MAADHQAHLLLPSPSPPPSPPLPSSVSSLSSTPSEDIQMDKFTAELTRRMAHYMLQEDDEELPLQYQSGSESSDFGGGFMGMEKSWGSADSSPTSLWSPPVTSAMKTEVDSAREVMPNDLINRFEKMDLAQKGLNFHNSHSQMNKAPSCTPALLPHRPDRVHQPNMAMPQNGEPRRRQFDRATPAKNERKHHHRTRQVSGSGMQAVFLGGSGSRSGSSGTGVFLPRGAAGNCTESRKQPRCSTVLIPARVAQALMTLSERTGSRSPAGTDGRFGLYFQQKGQNRAALDLDDDDTGLPQEWIY